MVNTDGARTIANGAGDTRALTPHGFARALTSQEEAQARTPPPRGLGIFAPKVKPRRPCGQRLYNARGVFVAVCGETWGTEHDHG